MLYWLRLFIISLTSGKDLYRRQIIVFRTHTVDGSITRSRSWVFHPFAAWKDALFRFKIMIFEKRYVILHATYLKINNFDTIYLDK